MWGSFSIAKNLSKSQLVLIFGMVKWLDSDISVLNIINVESNFGYTAPSI